MTFITCSALMGAMSKPPPLAHIFTGFAFGHGARFAVGHG